MQISVAANFDLVAGRSYASGSSSLAKFQLALARSTPNLYLGHDKLIQQNHFIFNTALLNQEGDGQITVYDI